MAPPKRPWFRVYTEAMQDRKLRRLTPAQRWTWIAVLSLACQSPDRGTLLLAEGQPCELDDIADEAAVTRQQARTGIDQFERLGMLTRRDSDGAWVVARWDARQYESDRSAERVRRHRQRQRNDDVTPDVTPDGTLQEGGDVTASSRAPATENREQRTETPPSPPQPAEPAEPAQPPANRGDQHPDPEDRTLQLIEAQMPTQLADGWRHDTRPLNRARQHIRDMHNTGWTPQELADAVTSLGWRGVTNPAGVVASRLHARRDHEPPSVKRQRQLDAEAKADADRDRIDTHERRAQEHTDAQIDALDPDERDKLARQAAQLIPLGKGVADLDNPTTRSMARAIVRGEVKPPELAAAPAPEPDELPR